MRREDVAAPAPATPGPAPRARDGDAPVARDPLAATPTETLRLRTGREDEEGARRSAAPAALPPGVASHPGGGQEGPGDGRRAGRIDVQAAIEGDDDKTRSLASVRRQRERERRQPSSRPARRPGAVVRDVVLPETITVQELANRMAARLPTWSSR